MKNTLISDIHFYLDRIIEVSNVEKSELESVMSSINKDIKDANLTELIALKCYVRDKYTILSDEINSNKNTDTTDTENATDVTNDISEPINNEDAEKEINEKSDVIEAGRDLINRIENGIGQVLELEQISKLINIKIDISDKIEEIEQSDGENDDYLVEGYISYIQKIESLTVFNEYSHLISFDTFRKIRDGITWKNVDCSMIGTIKVERAGLPKAKLTKEDVIEIRLRSKTEAIEEIARDYSHIVNKNSIKRVVNYETWKNI
jgi:hypothetical protein